MVFSGSIIYSAFSLLVSFFGVALIYALLSADFLAVTQLVLYVGGILVLILFAVMLTNRIEDTRKSNESKHWLTGLMLILVVASGLYATIVRTPWKSGETIVAFQPTAREIGSALLSTYVLPFEIASIFLLAGLIGAVVIARKEAHKQSVHQGENA